jgi:type I restriction enzyme S subunit
MANSPPTCPLGNLIISFDRLRKPVKEADRRHGPFPYYGASGVVDFVDQYIFEGTYLLVAEDGENLRTRQTPIAFLASGQFWVNNHAHVIQANDAADTRYLMYALSVSNVAAYLTGSTMPKLTAGNLARIPIPFRPLHEQHAIADVLSAFDDKIELNRKMSATLEGMARALFKSWFVDFDPVRAKAAGRDSGLSLEMDALFPDSLAASQFGEIPVGWSMRSLPELVEVNPSTPLAGVTEAPYLDMANVPTRGHAVGKVILRAISSGSRFRNGDTLIARITPCLENGKTAFVDFLSDGQVGWGSTEFIVLRPRTPAPAEYGYLLARSDDFRSFATSKMTGSSGRQRVPIDALSLYLVAQPSDAVFSAFASIIQPMFERMSAASRESRTLAAMRDTLLPKLISGELQAADAERIVAKSA